MPLNTAIARILLLSITVACGPDSIEVGSWMLGTYTGYMVNQSGQFLSITRYDILEDGVFVIDDVQCDGSDLGEPKVYEWKPYAEDIIEVSFPDVAPGGIEAWRISPGSDCNKIRVEWVQVGMVVKETSLNRGELCLLALGPCPPGLECDSCKTVWCDEAPPPCEE